MFYPGNAAELEKHVEELLNEARGSTQRKVRPRALILPHAGYLYSGLTAAHGYVLLEGMRARIRHVLLLGPSHYVAIHGMAVPDSDRLATPLGDVAVSTEMWERAMEHPEIFLSNSAHKEEHSLEVHLPFLRMVLDDFDVLPVAVGSVAPSDCGEFIDDLWSEDTLVLVSSDLSHFHDASSARRIDQETTRAIEALEYERLDHSSACGSDAIRGLLWATRKRRLTARTLELRTSADVTGDESEVVGYGAYVIRCCAAFDWDLPQ